MTGSSELELQRISEQKQELDERQMLVSHLYKLEEELEIERKKLREMDDRSTMLGRIRATEREDLRKRDAAEQELRSVEDQRERLRQSIAVLENEAKKIRDQIPGISKIDKFQILQNIRTGMKIKNIKVGQIEKEAGCTTGYMSRLEKKDSATTPSLEFVATAAEILGISMDLLVKSNLDEISPTDIYIVEFIEELTRRTKTQELSWKRYDPEYNPQENPFVVQVLSCDFGDNSPETTVTKYKSLFFDDAEIYTTGDGYWTQLLDGDSKVYIIPVLKSLGGVKGTTTEIYLTDGDNQIKPLFNTYECCKALSDAEVALHKAVRESVKNIHLDDKTKSIIDQFMSLGKRGD